MWEKLMNIDVRIIYGLVLVSIVLPLLWPMGLPIPVTKDVRRVYDTIQALPDSARVLFEFSAAGGSLPELEPQGIALLYHLAEKHAKLYIMSASTEAPLVAERALSIYRDKGFKAGVDYVNMGYFSGGESGIAAMCDSIVKTFPADINGTPTASMPIMQGVKGVDSMDLVIVMNGSGIADWVRQIVTTYKRPMVCGVLAVMGPGSVPYVQSGQIKGLLVGLKAAAEYEQLVKKPGKGAASMDAQSVAHLLVIGLVVLGNIGFYMNKKSRAPQGGPSNV